MPAYCSYKHRLEGLPRRAFQLTELGAARQRGLGAIPDARPMLFVGNHQTYALDIGFLVEQLVKERGIMPRGLAHPAIFAVRADVVVAATSVWCSSGLCE